MKKVKFSKRWRWPLTATSYEAYEAGDVVTVSNDRAEAAQKAGALTGEPEDVAETPASASSDTPSSADAPSDPAASKKPKA